MEVFVVVWLCVSSLWLFLASLWWLRDFYWLSIKPVCSGSAACFWYCSNPFIRPGMTRHQTRRFGWSASLKVLMAGNVRMASKTSGWKFTGGNNVISSNKKKKQLLFWAPSNNIGLCMSPDSRSHDTMGQHYKGNSVEQGSKCPDTPTHVAGIIISNIQYIFKGHMECHIFCCIAGLCVCVCSPPRISEAPCGILFCRQQEFY